MYSWPWLFPWSPELKCLMYIGRKAALWRSRPMVCEGLVNKDGIVLPHTCVNLFLDMFCFILLTCQGWGILFLSLFFNLLQFKSDGSIKGARTTDISAFCRIHQTIVIVLWGSSRYSQIPYYLMFFTKSSLGSKSCSSTISAICWLWGFVNLWGWGWQENVFRSDRWSYEINPDFSIPKCTFVATAWNGFALSGFARFGSFLRGSFLAFGCEPGWRGWQPCRGILQRTAVDSTEHNQSRKLCSFCQIFAALHC